MATFSSRGKRSIYIVDPKTNLYFKSETWEGMGELTPLGMRMLYFLGISTKKR